MKEKNKTKEENDALEKKLQIMRKQIVRDFEKKRTLGLNTQIQRMKMHYDLMTRV